MTAFYVPGLAGDARASDHAYGEMRRQLELDMGRRQSSRRIVSLWTRRGAVDCITEVGRPDPLRGGTVIAIFDMGSHQPFSFVGSKSPGAAMQSVRFSGARRTRCSSSTRELAPGDRAVAGRGRLLPRPGRASARQAVQMGPRFRRSSASARTGVGARARARARCAAASEVVRGPATLA